MTRRKRASTPPVSKSPATRATPRPGHPKRRRTAVLIALACLVAAGFVTAYLARMPRSDFESDLAGGDARGFHILLITLDTTRADRLGCYGYPAAQTPVLDQLAQEGVHFEQAIASVPVTLPSHATILTGLYPLHHGVRHNGEYRLSSEHMSLASLLKQQGYETAAFVSAFVLDKRYGLNQGFQLYDDTVDAATGAAFGDDIERSAKSVTDAALRWLRSQGSDRPFFGWVHYFDPHSPYEPPPPYAQTFAANPYDGEIAFMDSQIGRLVAWLKESGQDERTLVIVAGDHGESLGEHHEDTHSRLIYDATQRVPLILWSPALLRGPYRVDDAVVGLVDLFPTVLDLTGLLHDGPTDGLSLLRCRDEKDRAIYIESLVPFLDNGWSPLYGLRRLADKFILAPRPEYYELKSDPHELNNLFAGTSTTTQLTATKLQAELEARLQQGPTAAQAAAAAFEIDTDARRRLESLGYLAGSGNEDSEHLPDPKDMMPSWQQYLRVKRLNDSGRHAEAAAMGEQFLASAPRDRWLLQELGTAYALMGSNDRAEAMFKRYIEIKPGANVCLLLAQVLIPQNRIEEATALLDQASALEPEHGGVLIARGDLHAFRGDAAAAIALYEQAARVDPYRAKGAAANRITQIKSAVQMQGAGTP